ncbi:oxidoreductase [Lithospermum erythrorhizon]|uniref:Oxidoreductase n=1 Tax=Lithospermum erythrorhizon TaxID=34254 RepID=A0AAV3P267_LITER
MADAKILNLICQPKISVFNGDKNGIFIPMKLKMNKGEFFGGLVALGGTKKSNLYKKAGASSSQMTLAFPKTQKWWEKGIQPNMKEITGAQDLVDSLRNAGDKLVVVDFFSPGCGGCKALHPKICQLAEMNPHVQFLHVNYEEHKSMCYSLNVHVLPFFRFYRGAAGRVCSFSCTNATIKKFKDALVKYGADSSSVGLPKGLEEKELLALAANKDLSFTYTPDHKEPVAVPSESETPKEGPKSPARALPLPLPLPLPSTSSKAVQETPEKSLVAADRR